MRALAPILLVLAGACDPPDQFRLEPVESREARWRATWDGRGPMADDLVARRLLIGKGREDVLALLGPADAVSAHHLAYVVGAASVCSGAELAVDLDGEGRVIHAELQSDR